jgi:tRNA pseudouridine55 synthase
LELLDKTGFLLVDKPAGVTSFSLVHRVRKLTGVKKVGHCGTLDPFATGVMVLLVGRDYTRLSDTFLGADKTYLATLRLGQETDTYDSEGQVLALSDIVPSEAGVLQALAAFCGDILQVPPMYSAKKRGGVKLYELARRGCEVERTPVSLRVHIEFLSYSYPHLTLRVDCSKGTYIRSLAFDIGRFLGCGAHLLALRRERSGAFLLSHCLDGSLLYGENSFDVTPFLRKDLSVL